MHERIAHLTATGEGTSAAAAARVEPMVR
jgi:hypothetical protein